MSCLAYTLFESLVDGYFTVQDHVRKRIDDIEEATSSGSSNATTRARSGFSA
jgi:hypothetical protein